MARHAHVEGLVLVSVNYRKGPEVKCPGGQQDFATAVEHVYNNADSFGVDKNMICTSGVSGGGWICLGASHLLTKANKQHMVKMQMLWTPMLSNETAKVPKEQWRPEENDGAEMFKLLATNYDG